MPTIKTSKSLIAPLLVTMTLIGCADIQSTGQAEKATATTQHVVDAEAVAADIWAKEAAIFEGRGRGDLTNYLSVTSTSYLGWPPVMEKPLPLDKFKASADSASALKGEIITFEKDGFTLNENTAVAYFTTHRTRLGEGFAPEGERDVDEYYENTHIWTLEDGEWRLIGGMARKLPPTEGRIPIEAGEE